MKPYLQTTQEKGRTFYMNFHQKGKVVMLNLLRFKEVADYSGLDSIQPKEKISGKEAYDLYVQYTLPHLEAAGSKVLFSGSAGSYLIGPDEEAWDWVLLVEHESATKFIEFAQNEAYLEIAGHRTAALADSRLLPICQTDW